VSEQKRLSVTTQVTIRTTVTFRERETWAQRDRDAYCWAIAQANRIRRRAYARLIDPRRRPHR
jgi:hypothetical protein